MTADAWDLIDADVPVLTACYGPNDAARMTAVGDGRGGLVVYSPGNNLDDARAAALQAHGEVRWLMAPNHFHNAGLRAWRRRYPQARLIAHRTAVPRLNRRLGAEHPVRPLEAVDLGAGIEILSPPRARQGEAWLTVATRRGPIWIVGDAVFNQGTMPPGGQGLFWRLVGLGLRRNPVFWWLFLPSGAQMRGWLTDVLSRQPPAVLVPCHGSVDDGAALAPRLAAVFGVALGGSAAG